MESKEHDNLIYISSKSKRDFLAHYGVDPVCGKWYEKTKQLEDLSLRYDIQFILIPNKY